MKMVHYFVKDHKLSGNMENKDNVGAAAKWEAAVTNALTDAAIKCWTYLESNPKQVLAWISLIFGSGYVDFTNFVRTEI